MTQDAMGLLDQSSDGVQQRRIDHCPATGLFTESRGLTLDQVGTPLKIRDNPAFVLQRVLISAGVFNGDGCRIFRHETVTPRVATGFNTQNRAGHDLGAMQYHKPVHRPHKFRFFAAPSHPLRDGQFFESGLNAWSNDVFRGRTGRHRSVDEPLSLFGFKPLGLCYRDTTGSRKA